MHIKALPPVILRSVLLVCCILAVHEAILGKSGFLASEDLLYFTYQSNIWVMLVTAAYLVPAVRRLITGRCRIPHALEIIRYVAAVSISITMLVYWCILAPTRPATSIFTLDSQLLHTVVPLLFIADFLLFDRGKPVSVPGILWATVPLVYYLVFTFAYAAMTDFRFSSGRKYPYYILDVEASGWFGSGSGLGVFWWLLIILCLALALGALYRFARLKTMAKA